MLNKELMLGGAKDDAHIRMYVESYYDYSGGVIAFESIGYDLKLGRGRVNRVPVWTTGSGDLSLGALYFHAGSHSTCVRSYDKTKDNVTLEISTLGNSIHIHLLGNTDSFVEGDGLHLSEYVGKTIPVIFDPPRQVQSAIILKSILRRNL